jgi:hypothetical protein
MDETIINETTSKQILISGTSTRYQMKKVTQKKAPPRKRVLVEAWNLDAQYYTHEVQMQILMNDKIFPLFFQQIERKLQGYRAQDLEKKILEEENIVKLPYVLDLLKEEEMKCHYCKTQVFVLYEMARENCQWTLDRIDNKVGHNCGNVLVSCLQCNLKRRCINKDKFLMGKSMVLKKCF